MKYYLVDKQKEGWFYMVKNIRPTSKPLNYMLKKYNIDINDYYIIKKSGNFRILNFNDIEKYSGIICFNKSKYSLEYINNWIDFLYKEIKISVPYLSIPFPPEYMLNKIRIINKD